MFLSVISMACAAVVEIIRLHVAHKHGIQNDPDPRAVVPISIFWLLPQWILVASAELFSYVGVLEFFWSQTPMEVRSLGASFSFLSISLGFFLSGAPIFNVGMNLVRWVAMVSFSTTVNTSLSTGRQKQTI